MSRIESNYGSYLHAIYERRLSKLVGKIKENGGRLRSTVHGQRLKLFIAINSVALKHTYCNPKDQF